MKRTTNTGFTLVELLVVITIIGILIALLLPAVQAAREAARKVQCTNNIKQLALGAIIHEETHGFFPCGGWGLFWVGDPDRGFTADQPGGWTYNILPYIEQQSLRDLGTDSRPDVQTQMQLTGATQCISTPLSILHCPSRRSAITYPLGYFGGEFTFYGANRVTLVARTDYAACAGDQPMAWVTVGPPDQGPGSLDQGKQWTDRNLWPDTTVQTGIIFLRSQIRIADILDGVSNTFLIGEKSLCPDYYYNGMDGGDNETAFSPNDNDTARTTHASPYSSIIGLPHQDQTGFSNAYGFGSAHPGSCNFAMCDGSVRAINYSIDATTYSRLGNRKDGMVIDAKSY